MAWREVKLALLILLAIAVWVPWNTLIGWAREEAKEPPKDVL
jgi:hypothetical protein